VEKDATFVETYDIPNSLKHNELFIAVFEIERKFWKSTGRSNSKLIALKYFAENAVIISPSDAGFWVLTSRDDLMKIEKTSPPWTHCHYKHITFQEISDDVAILFYNILAKTTQFTDYGVMVCTTFKKFPDDSWKIISTHHSMPYSPGVDFEGYKRIVDGLE
jgi:hypothetical protein